MLFPIAPSEFWKQIKIIIEDVIAEKLTQQKISPLQQSPSGKNSTEAIGCM